VRQSEQSTFPTPRPENPPFALAMIRYRLTRLCLLLAVLVGVDTGFGVGIAAGQDAADTPRPLSIDDLYRFDGPTDVAVSPAGDSAVYVRRWNDRESRTVRYSLWRSSEDASRAKPLEAGQPDARRPIYSPDGRWIAFLSTRNFPDGSPAFQPVPPYTDPATDIWLMPAEGGKPIPLAGPEKPYGRVMSDPFYGRMAFSPDGKRLVFVADDGRDRRTPAEIENNVQIVREDQGEGYEGYTAAQIWIADLQLANVERRQKSGDAAKAVAARRVHRITRDDVWYGDPQWSPDGESLVVHANRTGDRESVRYSINKNYDLWRIDLADNSLTQLTTGPGPEVSPRLSPDGRRLVCLSVPRKGSHRDMFNLLVVDLATSGPQSRVLFDHHGPEADAPPHHSPSFPLPRDCWLSNKLVYFRASHRTGSAQQVIDLEQGPAALKNDSAADGEDSADAAPQDLSERLALEAAARRKLVPPGNQFLKDRVVAKGEVLHWKSFDGLEIEGVLTRPTRPGAKRPYPLVLYPHGGPHSRSTAGFNFTVQVLAAHGYAVFQPNYRGSDGYGQAWINADRFDLGGADMRDMLTGIDHLVAQGVVDRDRQFVYGVSYGGFTTSWLIGQTHQFRAAVPQNAVTDLTAMWGLSDIQSWTEWEFGGRPWETPQAMREHSPLTYAANVRTPTLILHAAGDRRCPLPMGRMFYRALKSAGVETQMVIYPDEGHPIRQLPHQQDVLRRVLDWFATHDK
jgi:dipeptidyl aminopeptidase/acylaminoacyl peptidase